MHPILLSLAAALSLSTALGAQATMRQAPAERIDVVAVVGCLSQDRTDMFLDDASGPIEIPDVDGRAVTEQMASDRPAGSKRYHLIGRTVLEEFDAASHVGHWVLVKGLPIVDGDVARLNVVSLGMVADTCK